MWKNRHFVFYALPDPLSVLHPPPKWYHHIAQVSAHLQPQDTLKPCHSSIEKKNQFSEGIFFWQITRMALESPKINICQNWPRRVLGDVISCLESTFDKKIPKCHGIRWFKCKLKPPKKVLYKFPNDIPLQLSTLHAINGWFTKTWKKNLNLEENRKSQKFLKGAFC